MNETRGLGRAVFAAVLLMIGGVLNIVYGIAAIGNSSFFTHHTHYVFGSLKTWGWVTLILGILEVLASLSLFQGGDFGRYFGIADRRAGGDRCAVRHCRVPVLVAGHIRAQPVDHSRTGDIRRSDRVVRAR